MAERVFVTGMGAITPVGNSVSEMWKSLREGRTGIGPLTRFEVDEYATKIAAEVKNFNPADFMDKRDARKMDAFSQYSVAAAAQAMEDAGLKKGDFDPYRAGIMLGVGIGGFETLESSYFALIGKGPGRVPPMTIPKLITNIGPANVAIAHGIHGPVLSMATACASGTDAITQALLWLRGGMLDFVIAGGVEACVTRMGIAGFNVIQALSTAYNDEPEKASRPFDADRDGFVMGEGSGLLVLESASFMKRRGGVPKVEVAGSAMTCDANHLTQPHPEGVGAIAAINAALSDANMHPEDIDYVNAHGTGTQINDPTEVKAIKGAFGEHAYKVPVSSTKSMTGHLVGAAGGVEAIITAMSIMDGFLPPTIHLDTPDPTCDLDHVPNVGRPARVRAAMSNSLGFGGHNGILILKQPA
ncbi:MAG: beta-ketoacyl-ACP synthase II [bacterium]